MDSLAAANVRQRPVRALVSAAGVALGVCLVMLFTGLARGMSNDLQRRSSNLRAEIIFTPTNLMRIGEVWHSGTWELVLQARAYENGVFIVGINKAGREWDLDTGMVHRSTPLEDWLGLPSRSPIIAGAFVDRMHPDDRKPAQPGWLCSTP